MAEATKTVVAEGIMGDQRYIIYELTNAANGETITTPLNDVYFAGGTNIVTADKTFGYTKSVSTGVAVLTLLINTSTDELRVMVIGK